MVSRYYDDREIQLQKSPEAEVPSDKIVIQPMDLDSQEDFSEQDQLNSRLASLQETQHILKAQLSALEAHNSQYSNFNLWPMILMVLLSYLLAVVYKLNDRSA